MSNKPIPITGRILVAGRITTCENHPQEFADDLNFETVSGLLIEMPDDDLRAAAGMLYKTIEIREAGASKAPLLGETAEEWSVRVRGNSREEREAIIAEACAPLEAAALAFTAGIIQAARTVIDPRNGDAVRIMVTRLKNGTREHRESIAAIGSEPDEETNDKRREFFRNLDDAETLRDARSPPRGMGFGGMDDYLRKRAAADAPSFHDIGTEEWHREQVLHANKMHPRRDDIGAPMKVMVGGVELKGVPDHFMVVGADGIPIEGYVPCPAHGVHSYPSQPCYVCGWKPDLV